MIPQSAVQELVTRVMDFNALRLKHDVFLSITRKSVSAMVTEGSKKIESAKIYYILLDGSGDRPEDLTRYLDGLILEETKELREKLKGEIS